MSLLITQEKLDLIQNIPKLELLQQICDILSICAQITEFMSGDKFVTLSTVLLTMQKLIDKLNVCVFTIKKNK